MPGSGDPTPFDGFTLVALCSLAVLLLIGCILGPRWATTAAMWLRWGALGLSVLLLGAVLTTTSTMSGVVGTGRLLTLYPAAAAMAVFFLIWSWRLGHL